MIRLEDDALHFSFPDVHPRAELRVDFQRTLRIPDDGTDHRLPPGLGRFPVRHVDDHAGRVPRRWLDRGGVMLPMYRSEAMWLNFGSGAGGFYGHGRHGGYPFAVKVAAGKINAVTGEAWEDGLHRDPQDYLVTPDQPWLDGFCVEKGTVRQFVAMELGTGYSVEEQLTGEAEHGGVQLIAYPMKREVYEEKVAREEESGRILFEQSADFAPALASTAPDMGLGAGGRMRQEIFDDPYDFDDWDLRHASRCFVHLTNALVWRAITGSEPPTTPPTAKEYTRAGLPWFDYYAADREALEGSDALARVKSVLQIGEEKGEPALPENESVEPERVVHLRDGLREDQVREGSF